MKIKMSLVSIALPILLVGCSTIASQNQPVTNTLDNVTTNTVSNPITNSVSNTNPPAQQNNQITANLVTPYSHEMQHTLNDLCTQTKTPLYAPVGNVGLVVKYEGTEWSYEIELASGVWIFGTTYQNHVAAMNAMAGEFPINKIIDDGPIEQGSPLHQYRTGATYSNGMVQEVIYWNEGKWEICVFGAPSLDLINTAKTVDKYLNAHTLPPTDGRLFVDPSTETNAVPKTQIGFVSGDTYYLVEGQNMNDTLAIATSLRVVSSRYQG